MRHNRYVGFLPDTDRGYLVAFDMFWNVVESRRVDASMGARRSLECFIAEYLAAGWTADGAARYGFVFMRRGENRLLIEATARDPRQTGSQSFSPFTNPRGR